MAYLTCRYVFTDPWLFSHLLFLLILLRKSCHMLPIGALDKWTRDSARDMFSSAMQWLKNGLHTLRTSSGSRRQQEIGCSLALKEVTGFGAERLVSRGVSCGSIADVSVPMQLVAHAAVSNPFTFVSFLVMDAVLIGYYVSI